MGAKSHLLLSAGQEVCNLLADEAGCLYLWQLVMERARDGCVKAELKSANRDVGVGCVQVL